MVMGAANPVKQEKSEGKANAIECGEWCSGSSQELERLENAFPVGEKTNTCLDLNPFRSCAQESARDTGDWQIKVGFFRDIVPIRRQTLGGLGGFGLKVIGFEG